MRQFIEAAEHPTGHRRRTVSLLNNKREKLCIIFCNFNRSINE